MSVVGIVRFLNICDFNLKIIGKSLESWKLSDKLEKIIIRKIYSSYDRIDSWIFQAFSMGIISGPLANSDTQALESIVLLAFHGSVTTAVLPIVTSWCPPNAFQFLRISVFMQLQFWKMNHIAACSNAALPTYSLSCDKTVCGFESW